MTRAEAKQNGFNVITNWQLIWIILGFIFIAGGSFSLSQYRINENEKDIKELQEKIRTVDEINLNLRNFMEAQGFHYQQLK